MPLSSVGGSEKPCCAECRSTESVLWEKTKTGEIQCSKCFSVNSRRLRVVLSGPANLCTHSRSAEGTSASPGSVRRGVEQLEQNVQKTDDTQTSQHMGSEQR